VLSKPLRPTAVAVYAAVCLGMVYLLLHPEMADVVRSHPSYGYSGVLFCLSAVVVFVIVRRSTPYLPSLFLLIFFVAVPVLGTMNAKQYFGLVGSYFGRSMPSFDFPTLLYSIGAISFFAGVLLGWFVLPKSRRSVLVLWDHKRMVLLLSLSLVMASVGTILAFSRIGYVPLLKSNIGDLRVSYFNTVGALTNRFSQHWPVPALLASMLFFLERSRKRYVYLGIVIICAFGTLFYAQRTGIVWVMSAFALMYFKFSRPRAVHLLVAVGIALVLVYGLMLQFEYRSGQPALETENRVVKHAFPEWSQYSIVVNEARTESRHLGWQIFAGPFFTFIPRQIYSLLGYDKGALILDHSAVYYYGKQFNEPYGIRVTPVGEAFAAYGLAGVIVQMLALGLVFGALERSYFGLDRSDARLCLVCYVLSLMTHLPITTMFVLLIPLTVTGVFVVAYYFLGTRKYNVAMV
jgi:oligosaccharide repeat unit polymerase